MLQLMLMRNPGSPPNGGPPVAPLSQNLNPIFTSPRVCGSRERHFCPHPPGEARRRQGSSGGLPCSWRCSWRATPGTTLSDVNGYDKQLGSTELSRGVQVDVSFLPKTLLALPVSDGSVSAERPARADPACDPRRTGVVREDFGNLKRMKLPWRTPPSLGMTSTGWPWNTSPFRPTPRTALPAPVRVCGCLATILLRCG